MIDKSDAKLTIFFVVEPPKYQNMGCYLTASIRCHFNENIKLVGYCSKEKIGQMDAQALAAFKTLDVDIRPMDTEARFDPPYPHGNKILAALEPRDTPYSAFMDSDMLFISENTSTQMIKPGHVGVAPATSMYWSGQKIWNDIYAACGMEKPQERIWLSRQRNRKMMPYFNAGLIVFPEGPTAPNNETFAQVWYRLARQIDCLDIEKKRPYLDQMSLPLAIRAAGLNWNILPEEQHYILGGSLRGKPLPADKDVKMIHYRNPKVLREIGYSGIAKDMLQKTTGLRKIAKGAPVPPIASDDWITRRVIYEGTHLRLEYTGPLLESLKDGDSSARVVVSFAPVDYPFDNPDAQGWGTRSFTKRGIAHVNVFHRAEDWHQNADFFDAMLACRAYFGPDIAITTYGFSMGGFGALLAAKTLQAERCVAISPQASIDTSVVPFERRFFTQWDLMDSWTHDLNDHMADHETSYIVLYDPLHGRDQKHEVLLPKPQGYLRCPMHGLGHGGVQSIVDMNIQETLFDLLRGRASGADLRNAYREQRATGFRYVRKVGSRLHERKHPKARHFFELARENGHHRLIKKWAHFYE